MPVDPPAAPFNPLIDAKVIDLAARITDTPDEFLDARDARVLRATLQFHDATQADLAKALGYRNWRSFNNRLRRLKGRLIAAVSRELADLPR